MVSTVQTLSYNNKFKKVFKPTDFSLIIADESHRSISGNSRAVFEYFIGYKLGLTATPKDYLKNVDADDLIASDPRAWERRQLLDTYKTFGCESGEPTFRYSLIDGVNDPDGPYLVNPTVVDARTDITTQLLADKGYAVISHGDEEDEDAEETYFARDFEKKFFSDETNKIFVKTFMDNAMRDPLTGEIGKGIIFCVSRKHAAKITQLLNVYADKMFPDMYYSDFAMQIKNIKGRAGRYYHCFIGRVFYMTKELQEIEDSDSMTLNFVTYSDNELSVIDLDNAEIEDLTSINAQRKTERETVTQQFVLPQEVFFKNRTVSKENQEKLLHLLMTDSEFSKYSPLLTHTVDVEGFLHYRWINKILNTFYNASLIDEITCKKFSAIANNYYEGGFKALLGYEVGKYRRGYYKSMDRAYSEAFKSLKDVLEHKIPKILSLFESIVVFVAKQEGIGVETFSLSRVRRYYETGVKSLLGEALIEYGFPTDAIRRIEENHKKIKSMTVSEAKEYCRLHFREVQLLLDAYERSLFIKAMRTF